MIALPPHEPCGLDGCGEPTPGNIMEIQCTARITFTLAGKPTRARGCGAVSKTCGRCGLRAKWDDGPCGACERAER